MLAYLATARPRGYQSRDALLALFWPDADGETARNRLRQALFQLRKSLGDDAFLTRADHEIAINGEVVQCDAASFDQAFDESRFEDALALYRGEFLAGFFVDDSPEAERWIEEERARRNRNAVEAALKLAEREQQRREFRAAAHWARLAVGLAPYDEHALRTLLKLLDASGEKAAALDAFGEFEKRLAADLDLAPSQETVDVVTAIRSSKPDVPVRRETVVVAEPVVEAIAVPKPAAPKRNYRYAVAAVAAVVLLSVGFFAVKPKKKIDLAQTPTLAVLPFVNVNGDSINEYFSVGVTEEILNALASIDGLRLAARTSSFAFKNEDADVKDVGKRLGVEHVLEGSVRRAGNRIKISAQLVNTADGYQAWSQTYDREAGDIFAVQEEIARAITNALQIKLGRADDAALERRATSSAEAYDLYLRGKYLVTARNQDRNKMAIDYFEQSIAKDHRFALPYAGLARAYIAMGQYVPPRTVLPKARQAALRALQLDSSLVETRLALADVRQVYDRDWQAAEREIQHAITMSPRSPAAHAAYAGLLLDERRFDEAYTERKHAWGLRHQTEPDTLLPAFRVEEATSWGVYFNYIGKNKLALEHADAALALDPANLSALWLKVIASHDLGRYNDAIAGMQRLHELTHDEVSHMTHLARAYAASGRRKEAEVIRDSLIAISKRQYLPKDNIALLYLSLGDTTKALDWLEKAVEDYHWWMPNANSHPMWNGLHENPRFQALMKKIGAP